MSFNVVDRFVKIFVNLADPVHSITEQARKDPSCQVLRSSRGFRETQGRIRGMIFMF